MKKLFGWAGRRLRQRFPHIVTVEVQGDHSVKPPVDDLRQTALIWINWLFRSTREPLSFILQVECRRFSCNRRFQGVKVLCLPEYNPTSVELRLRPDLASYQWKAHLICPSAEVAQSILRATRPDATAFLDNWAQDEHEKATTMVYHSRDTMERFTQRLASRQKHRAQRVNLIRRRRMKQRLCAVLEEKLGAPLNLVSLEDLQPLLQELTGKEVDRGMARDAAAVLVEQGLLEPHHRNPERIFAPTVLFDQYAAEYREACKEEELERLEREKLSLIKCREAACREQARLLEKARETERQILNLNEKIQDVEMDMRGLR